MRLPKLDIGDMLVFKNEHGAIFQDCINAIVECRSTIEYHLNSAIAVFTIKKAPVDYILKSLVCFSFRVDTSTGSNCYAFRTTENPDGFDLQQVYRLNKDHFELIFEKD